MNKKRENRTILALDSEGFSDCPVIDIRVEAQSPNNQSENTHKIYVLDINTNGMGITCDILLKVGQIIHFENNNLDWALPSKGTVMWTFKAKEGFRAGIKFNLP